MLASVEKKFVLLSNPKTGTTALETAFEKYADIRTGGSPKWKHIRYVDMKDIFGDYFERQGCQIYAVVRHPIDTLASWYKYRTRKALTRRKAAANYSGGITFPEFVEEWASDRPPPRARVPVSVRWCMTRRGTPAPINFYRYEDIALLVAKLSAHVGERVDLPRTNVSPERDVGIDREHVAALPKMKACIEMYEAIPFVTRR
jgi:hypothetical protein